MNKQPGMARGFGRMAELSVLNHENLSNTVYATLCDALISGKFKPGDRLKIRDLAERLGTSVTPVRDAIIRLSHDHAVTFQTARNIQIPVLTEAAYLADEIIVMSARPGRIIDRIEVDLPRPRTYAMMATSRFAELRERIWSQIKTQASE